MANNNSLNIQLLFVGLILASSCLTFVNCAGCADDPMPPPKCPPDLNFIPYPYDCRKYYECSNGIPVCFECPPGTVWDQSLPGCNHEGVVPCVIVTTPSPGGTTPPPTTTRPTTTVPSTTTPPTTTTRPTTTTPPTTTTTTPTTTTRPPTTTTTTPTTTRPPTTTPPLTTTPPPTTKPPTTTSPPGGQIIIDVREDIPEGGPLEFACYLGYGVIPSDFFCGAGDRVDFPPEDLHGEEGFWTRCQNQCEITYNSQPGHSKFLARFYQRNAEAQVIVDGFHDFVPGAGWVEYSRELEHDSGNHKITIMLDIHGSDIYTLLDKIVISVD